MTSIPPLPILALEQLGVLDGVEESISIACTHNDDFQFRGKALITNLVNEAIIELPEKGGEKKDIGLMNVRAL